MWNETCEENIHKTSICWPGFSSFSKITSNFGAWRRQVTQIIFYGENRLRWEGQKLKSLQCTFLPSEGTEIKVGFFPASKKGPLKSARRTTYRLRSVRVLLYLQEGRYCPLHLLRSQPRNSPQQTELVKAASSWKMWFLTTQENSSKWYIQRNHFEPSAKTFWFYCDNWI